MQLTRDNGSSPLTRGKPCLVRNRSPLGGLIPAHAGKTLLMPAHMPSMKGSSPLTRGKPSGQAGPAPPTPAHPRSRGENSVPPTGVSSTWGSSPLTRGKHFLTCAFIAQIGQILESLELCASSESYSSPEAYATDALQGRVRSIDLGLRSSRGAS